MEQHDAKALQGFIEETNESLQNIEYSFIRLEKDPTNTKIIDEIFRPVHSMKGNSGFFNLTNINKFSHRMENLLDYISNGEVTVTKEIVDILLTGIDYLQKMLDRVYDDPTDVAFRPDEEAFLTDKVDKCRPKGKKGSTQSIFRLQALFEEAVELGINIDQNGLFYTVLDHVENACSDIGKFVDDHKATVIASLYFSEKEYVYNGEDYSDLLKPVGRVIKKLNDQASIDKELIQAFKENLKKLGEILKSDKKTDNAFEELHRFSGFFDDDILLLSTDFYNLTCKHTNEIISRFEFTAESQPTVKRIGEILIDQGKISEEQLSGALDKQEKIGELLIREGAINKSDLEDALGVQNNQIIMDKQSKKSSREAGKTIRIDQHKLDDFANSVGELFINLDSFNFLKNQLESTQTDYNIMSRFNNTISSMDERVIKLQEDIMDIRKVPVKSLFQRFPRVVRQLSTSLEKDINFTIAGEDTVIDKDLLEKIENPLVHILRNAIDHGIERPEERAEKNKQEQGKLFLKAWMDEYYVYLSVKDDGKGIDPQNMKKVAVENQFMTESEVGQLSEKELINLIFMPGFSSAESVSDVSGRGVGMDVVMSGIKECNGTLEVDSVPDRGTTVIFKIPLTKTLVTTDALIVESAGQLFAIPSEEITTTLSNDVKSGTILKDNKVISYNDHIHSIINMGEFYYSDSGKPSKNGNEQSLVVCSKYNVALFVDKMFNHQKIVVKNFEKTQKQFRNIPGINGYTILGNEDIVLIVDVENINRLHNSQTDRPSHPMSDRRPVLKKEPCSRGR